MSERAGFTPGPWLIGGPNVSDSGCLGIHDEAERWVIADVWRDSNQLKRQAEANARLIAAAPDMFEALLQAREWLSGWASADSQLAVIDAALSRAGGSHGL